MNRAEETAIISTLPVRQAWIAYTARALGPGGLYDVVKNEERRGLFTDWRHMSVPVSTEFFGFALDVFCGAPEKVELANTFLGYIRQQVERAQSEPQRWHDESSGAWGYPFMKETRWYDLQRSDLYSKALLGHSFVVEECHLEALQGCASHYASETGQNWDVMSQSGYIECALVALAWGRPDMAQGLLKVRRSFKWTQRYVDWSRELVSQLAKLRPQEPISSNSALWAHFHSLFDELRHPTKMYRTGEEGREAARRGEGISSSSMPLLRLVLAMIKQRYLLQRPIDPGLRAVIELISE